MAERITIIIDTDNDAFADMPGQEVAGMLRDLALVFARGGFPGERLRDSNGNTCGSVAITHKPEEV